MTIRADELTEARAILRALERCKPKNDGDGRFLESWRGYLNRTRATSFARPTYRRRRRWI